ncbi:hypothetical protein IEQ34_022174 [Dendrobium chrysotoxum]|uniref:Uncharacterized protein n=1 Tax=Dendrobium chrysotoxum TaxID=161865 RepID=A0AAV7FX09_DENCH|nr:hypothetical protein IEQ34_022174 [Dendrobium chrysotoxum]
MTMRKDTATGKGYIGSDEEMVSVATRSTRTTTTQWKQIKLHYCQATNRLLHFSLINLQQKVVLNLSMEDAKKRSKAMQCAVGMHGVLSVSHEGDKMTVVGEGIDSVALTRLLRKKMGYVELEVVTTVEEKKEEKKVKVEAEGIKSNIQPVILPYYYGQSVGAITQPPYYYVDPSYDQNNCSIM